MNGKKWLERLEVTHATPRQSHPKTLLPTPAGDGDHPLIEGPLSARGGPSRVVYGIASRSGIGRKISAAISVTGLCASALTGTSQELEITIERVAPDMLRLNWTGFGLQTLEMRPDV